MRDETLGWFKQSLEDFDSAKVNFREKKYYLTVFLCQQAIEKGLKALLLNTRKDPNILSHSLVFLSREAGVPSKFDMFIRMLSR